MYNNDQDCITSNKTVFNPCEEGGCVAKVPMLLGCLSQGETISECMEEVETVRSLWLESTQIQHRSIPSVEMVTQKLRSMSAA
ncbi:MAG: type II toxin-antitoxin system HicB family antitoxin [Candidatus Kapaibacterium sp.]|nr:MAG: type II toxin-antitoxin system HicB family antitoxin [Candidatus Kapabacteria bacterium]